MKISFLTVGDKTVASTRARVYGYLPFLEEKGIRHEIFSFTSKGKINRLKNMKKDSFAERIYEVLYKACILSIFFIRALKCDIIFVQKVVLPASVWFALRSFHKKIIFDFDDALYIHKNIERILRNSTSVIVSNSYLKDYVSKFNKKVIELISPVEICVKVNARQSGNVTLGWIGSPETSAQLNGLFRVFDNLVKEFSNLNIEFMGASRDKAFESIGIKYKDWALGSEDDYLANIDIGIMPLSDDEPSRAKGGYKLLRYMSCGIPCVASPIGINKKIIENNVNGYFASSDEEWLEKLSLLIKDSSLRHALGRKGREMAEALYSYEANASKFIDFLTSTASLSEN